MSSKFKDFLHADLFLFKISKIRKTSSQDQLIFQKSHQTQPIAIVNLKNVFPRTTNTSTWPSRCAAGKKTDEGWYAVSTQKKNLRVLGRDKGVAGRNRREKLVSSKALWIASRFTWCLWDWKIGKGAIWAGFSFSGLVWAVCCCLCCPSGQVTNSILFCSGINQGSIVKKGLFVNVSTIKV